MIRKQYLFIVLICVFSSVVCEILRIGAVFDSNDKDKELAFRYALKQVNKDRILTRFTLEPEIQYIEQNSPLSAVQTVCNLLSKGVAAIFGPSSNENAYAVQSICDAKDIPHIEVRWEAKRERGGCLVNLYPHPDVIAKIFADIVKQWQWNGFTILYENDDSLSRISELLKLYDHQGYSIAVKQLDKNNTGDYRNTFKEVRTSQETHFVVDCTIDHLSDVLTQAQQVGLMTSNHHYIITNLDLQSIDLEPFKYSGTNITAIRLTDNSNHEINKIATKIQKMSGKTNFEAMLSAWKFQLESALTIDAVSLFAEAISDLETTNKLYNVPSLYCNTTDNWKLGDSIITFMKTKNTLGLSGPIIFDREGFRSDISVDVVELKEGGITKVGIWNQTYQDYRVDPKKASKEEISLRNTTFKVLITITAPYNMLKKSQTQLTGNDRYEGFGIDLIHELSLLEGFNYTFFERSGTGVKIGPGKWTGLLGDIMIGEADLAITDLTITSEREEAVDFTSPFMNLGISILYKKPSKAPPNFFSFAEPFAFEVWLLLGAAYFGVSISLFIMGRLCPSEWTNPYPCIEEPEFLINQFSLRNSFWFTIGSLMQQGTEIAPIAISTRMVAGMWWFFTLIMVSSYTANLAAFLTTESPESPFSNVRELVEKAEYAGIKYGAKLNGATANFFKESNVSEYRKIAKKMKEWGEEVMVRENDIGVEKAINDKYAFFMESTSIEYTVERKCNLTKVGDLLDEKGYGIAMRKNSTYRNKLSTAVLKLQETGKIDELKRKWWQERSGGGVCRGEGDSQEAKALNLKSVGGVFWVSVGGIIIAIAFVFIEMLLHVAKDSIKNRATFKEELKEEIKFYFKFKGMVKPVRNRKSLSKSPEESNKSQENSLHYGFINDISSKK